MHFKYKVTTPKILHTERHTFLEKSLEHRRVLHIPISLVHSKYVKISMQSTSLETLC